MGELSQEKPERRFLFGRLMLVFVIAAILFGVFGVVFGIFSSFFLFYRAVALFSAAAASGSAPLWRRKSRAAA
jgi:hypothetical protein